MVKITVGIEGMACGLFTVLVAIGTGGSSQGGWKGKANEIL